MPNHVPLLASVPLNCDATLTAAWQGILFEAYSTLCGPCGILQSVCACACVRGRGLWPVGLCVRVCASVGVCVCACVCVCVCASAHV